MSQEVTAEGIVLRKQDSGESDRRLTILTREHGKLDAIAKGARKSGSRLAGSSEPLIHAVFHFAAGRQRRFVTQVQPLTSFPSIRSDYGRLCAGLAMAETMEVAMPWESPEGDHYDLMLSGLGALSEGDPGSALAWWWSRLLEQEGHHPSWLECQIDGPRELERPCWFSPVLGGRVHSSQAPFQPDAVEISPEALIALDRLPRLAEPPARYATLPECLWTLFMVWQSVLERPLRAGKSAVQTLA